MCTPTNAMLACFTRAAAVGCSPDNFLVLSLTEGKAKMGGEATGLRQLWRWMASSARFDTANYNGRVVKVLARE